MTFAGRPCFGFIYAKTGRHHVFNAELAQSGERQTEDLKVASSILAFRIFFSVPIFLERPHYGI